MHTSFVIFIVQSCRFDAVGFAPAVAQCRIDTQLSASLQESRAAAIGDDDSGWQRHLLVERPLPTAQLSKLAVVMGRRAGVPQLGDQVPCLARFESIDERRSDVFGYAAQLCSFRSCS